VQLTVHFVEKETALKAAAYNEIKELKEKMRAKDDGGPMVSNLVIIIPVGERNNRIQYSPPEHNTITTIMDSRCPGNFLMFST
jgi:hypothetical protein